MERLYDITGLIFMLISLGLFLADVNGIDTNNLYLLFALQSSFMYVMAKLTSIENKNK